MDRRADLLAAEHVVRGPGVVGIERHELDEADLVGVLTGELRERDDLGLGEAPHGDRVDLDRVRLRERREHLEAAQDLLERVAAGDLAEALALERIHRDVEAGHTGRHQRLGVAFELVAVGRQRQLVQAGDRREPRDEAGQLAAHERLAAGQPDIAARPSPRAPGPAAPSPRSSTARSARASASPPRACSTGSENRSGRSPRAADR